jgi:hypothetical protein
MYFFPLQILAVGITSLAYLHFAELGRWTPLVFALGFCHYLVAMIYSARPLRSLATQGYSYLPFVLLLGAGWWLYDNRFPLEIYFALHHLFNEAYLKGKLFPDLDESRAPVHNMTLLALLHGSAYILLIRSQSLPIWLNGVLVVLFLVCVAVYLSRVWSARAAGSAGVTAFLNRTGLEWLCLVLVPVSFFYQFDFKLIVFYHFVIWGLLPLQHQLTSGRHRAALVYVGISVAAFLPFYLISPLGPPHWQVPYYLYAEQFLFWSYFHITVSFALSRAHPGWINYWFEPRLRATAPA